MSIFNTAKEKAQQAQFEASKLFRINQVQREIGRFKREIQQIKFQVGNTAYELYLQDKLAEQELKDKCEDINKIEREIQERQSAIEGIQDEEFYFDEERSINMPSVELPTNLPQGRLPTGHKIASPAAALAIMFFFMPWIFASCGTQPIGSFSGWDFASGTTISTGFGSERMPASPHVFLVLLSAIAVLVLAYFAWQRGQANKLDGFGLIALGVLALLIVYLGIGDADFRQEAAREGIVFELMYGFWGTILSFIAIVIGGILNLRQPRVNLEDDPESGLDFEES